MTDKEIIIDGVDVKDCKRRIGKDNFCRYYKRPCTENNYNCIWKKYLRKEQECDMWKNLTIDNGAVALKYQQQLDKLKKANDEKNELLAQLGCPTVGTARQLTLSLKEQLEAYKMEAEEGKEINAELKVENERLKEKINSLLCSTDCYKYKQAEKYKQTLTYIKEMIPPPKGAKLHLVFEEILKKISEVEDER